MREEVYKGKITTAQEAARLVKPGDRVYVGTASSFAYELLDALWDRRAELEDVQYVGETVPHVQYRS